MNLLLDTHVVLWAFSEPLRLSESARSAIVDPQNVVAVSAATIWEIEIKRALGKLDAPPGIAALCVEREFDQLPITSEHAELAANLPLHHSDPFDRMLIGQAIRGGYRIATVERAFAAYDVELLDPLAHR
jgi:PIN domain nuclease of toxin-antitoxin system